MRCSRPAWSDRPPPRRPPPPDLPVALSRLLSRYWLLVPLILVAILVRNWVEEPETLSPEEPLAMQTLRADYYLEDFTTRRFDAAGALEYLLRGETLSHFPDDDRAEIRAPSVELHRPDALWDARADMGTLVRVPRDVVTLAGDVVVDRTPDPLTVRADDLAVSLDSNEVSTDGRVELSGPGYRLDAVGLRSSIDAGKLELLSEVTGRYEVAIP